MSDPLIVADVQRIQRELVLLLAKEAIIDSDNLGGAVGERVRDVKSTYLRAAQKTQLDPKDIDELAESLTLGGRDWVIVMPGVICTLPIRSCGPCARGATGRDPGNCQSGCRHQILLSYNMTETDDTVAYIIGRLEEASKTQSININMWVSQLRNWLYRWPQVYAKWASHPLVIAYSDPSLSRPGGKYE